MQLPQALKDDCAWTCAANGMPPVLAIPAVHIVAIDYMPHAFALPAMQNAPQMQQPSTQRFQMLMDSAKSQQQLQ